MRILADSRVSGAAAMLFDDVLFAIGGFVIFEILEKPLRNKGGFPSSLHYSSSIEMIPNHMATKYDWFKGGISFSASTRKPSTRKSLPYLFEPLPCYCDVRSFGLFVQFVIIPSSRWICESVASLPSCL